MASVWVGDDSLLARRVAIKTLRPELAGDEGTRARFRHEAVAVASLTHPHIVATYDTGEDDDLAYLVMELIDGPNLRRYLDERGPLPIPDVLRIARGVVAALGHAHSKGIVHRDIKPANVLVPASGPAKVTDFGIAKVAGGADLTATGSVMGTAKYLAPEQVRGEPADARADLYAVGLLLYEMLTGQPPFGGDTDTAAALARLTVAPAPVRTHRPEVPPDLEGITLRCLAIDPAQRYPDAEALGAVLGRFERGDSPDTAPRGTPSRVGEPPTSAPVLGTDPTSDRTSDRTRRTPPVARRRSVAPWVLVGIAMLAIGSAGGYLVVSAARDPGTSSTAETANGPRIAGATDFDPEGGDGENARLTGLAVDGDPATAWSTETYHSPAFGGAKSGVGIELTLAASADVSSVEVQADGSGWSAQIFVGRGGITTLEGWGPARATAQDLGTDATFSIDPTAQGTAVLVWLTRLPSSGRLKITEIRVA